jgi:hypothetical protein
VITEMRTANYSNWGLEDPEAQVEAWAAQLKRIPSFLRLAELCLGLRVVATEIACLNIQSVDADADANEETDAADDEAADKDPAPEPASTEKGKARAVTPVASTSEVPPNPLQEQGLVRCDPEVSPAGYLIPCLFTKSRFSLP